MVVMVFVVPSSMVVMGLSASRRAPVDQDGLSHGGGTFSWGGNATECQGVSGNAGDGRGRRVGSGHVGGTGDRSRCDMHDVAQSQAGGLDGSTGKHGRRRGWRRGCGAAGSNVYLIAEAHMAVSDLRQ